MNNLLDDAGIQDGFVDSDNDIRGCANGHNTACDDKEFHSRCFSATRQDVEGKQEEVDIDAWKDQLYTQYETGSGQGPP